VVWSDSLGGAIRVPEAAWSHPEMPICRVAAEPTPRKAGEMIIDGIETGFSPKDPKRNPPYVVIGCAGRRARVMPQSTDRRNGVHVLGGKMDGLEEGCFVPCSTTIRLLQARPKP
jgi:hypothetical protein